MKDDFCDNPCSPDKQYCFVNACCGSRDGRYFTVAFAGQVRPTHHKMSCTRTCTSSTRPFAPHIYKPRKKLDPVLQLLRQLTYDYRTNNPKLRAHIKELMGASAPLQAREATLPVLLLAP